MVSVLSELFGLQSESGHLYEKDREHGRIKRIQRKGNNIQPTVQGKNSTAGHKGARRNWGPLPTKTGSTPNMLRNWKREFLEKVGTVFEDPKKAEKQTKRREKIHKKETERMLKTIG